MSSEPVNLRSPQQSKSQVGVMRNKSSQMMRIFVVCVLLIGIGVAVYYYGKRAAVSETDNVVRDVGMHLILPEGAPRIGKISDTSQFTKDPFLSQSLVDDVVLFYPHDGRTVKAILWRPSVKKIVDVALVTLPDATAVK
jgi:uncharacterized protein YjeT (DUF2065 family)